MKNLVLSGTASMLLLISAQALAETSPLVGVQGKVGDFNNREVELTVKGGTVIHVPRSQIRPKNTELRPGKNVIAIVDEQDIRIDFKTQ
jgi:hypothetical protein